MLNIYHGKTVHDSTNWSFTSGVIIVAVCNNSSSSQLGIAYLASSLSPCVSKFSYFLLPLFYGSQWWYGSGFLQPSFCMSQNWTSSHYSSRTQFFQTIHFIDKTSILPGSHSFGLFSISKLVGFLGNISSKRHPISESTSHSAEEADLCSLSYFFHRQCDHTERHSPCMNCKINFSSQFCWVISFLASNQKKTILTFLFENRNSILMIFPSILNRFKLYEFRLGPFCHSSCRHLIATGTDSHYTLSRDKLN